MKWKEFKDLVVYSTKYLLEDFISILGEIKKPKTWLSILYVGVGYGIYTQNSAMVKIATPLILIIYIIRQKIDGSYRKDKFLHDVLRSRDTYIVKEYYENYLKSCKIKKIIPHEYNIWKTKQIKNYYKNNKNEIGQSS